MKSYFRFLSRNKLYTTIEVLGMAIAIAFVVFIGSFVIREYNTDSDIKKQGNIYISAIRKDFCLAVPPLRSSWKENSPKWKVCAGL